MQIRTQNGHQWQKYMHFFKQHIFRGMHDNDVKFIHNIYYMVLHGVMRGYIARIKMKKCPLFVDVLQTCRKYMIARILNLIQLVEVLSDGGQHQIVSH